MKAAAKRSPKLLPVDVAVDAARDHAIARVDALFREAVTAQDSRTALAAQKELNRLMGLYSQARGGQSVAEDQSTAARQLSLIASYLLPLHLAAETYPIEEHARLAAERIRRNGLPELSTQEGTVAGGE